MQKKLKLLEVNNVSVNESKTELTAVERKKKRNKKTDENVKEP